MYGVIESIYCTPETNVTLYVNYTGIKTKKLILKIPERKRGGRKKQGKRILKGIPSGNVNNKNDSF